MSLQLPSLRPRNVRTVSDSDIPSKSSSPDALDLHVPTRPPNTRQSSRHSGRSDTGTPHGRSGSGTPHRIPTSMNNSIPGAQVIELLAGVTSKSFYVHTELLKSRSPYFRDLFSVDKPASTSSHPPPLKYPDLDEFAMALFIRWLYGAMLNGPSDYHSMQHYLALYVLALKFRIERLCNEIMDLVRRYYLTANMTAPPHRLEYIYTRTQGPNQMRRFMTCTAAYRALCEGAISDGLRDALGRERELSSDFALALVDCHRRGLVDCRRGSDCVWHEHRETSVCKATVLEPWQTS